MHNKLTIDWTKSQALERLLVELLASHDHVKFDYTKMAEMFGEGATVNSIKGHFARLKKMIPALGDLDEGVNSTPTRPNHIKRAEKKPKKIDDAGIKCEKVLKGRVEKTPTKSKKCGIKDENAGSGDGFGS